MCDDVETRLDWALDPWGGKCVVGYGNDFSLARDFRDRFQINEFQQRITRRFDPNHARVCLNCALEIFRVSQIDIRKIKLRRAAPHSIKQSKCAAVKVIAGYDMRAAVEHLEHGRHRSEAGCKGEPARSAFQIGNALFIGQPRRIDRPRVIVTFMFSRAFLHVR